MIGKTLSHYRILERFGGSVVVLLVVLVSAPAFLGAAPDIRGPRPVLAIPRVDRPPALEDFLDMKPNGEMEGALAKVEGVIQREPSDGAPSSQDVEVYLGYDDKNLYVIFVAFDSEPKKVRARMVSREGFRGDDFVQVLLDTFHDQRRAYSFMANPFGIQRDALFTEGEGRRGGGGGCEGSFDFSFDTLWYSKGKLTDQGYVIWMAIPFKSLRFPPNRQQIWGILLYRNIPRVNEEAFWPHCSSRIQGRLNQAATLRGLENISPGRNIQLTPYGALRSFRSVDTRDEAQPRFVRDRADFDGGLDAKLVVKDSLVVDVAVNPDFSQVESDEPQVTVNQRFEVFFPEKRPFFLENASFFETPINLLFTRRIADPRFGVRLTGKLGAYALGAFVIDDESPGKRVPANDPLQGKRAWFSTVRVSRDLGAQSTLGFIFTDREFENSFNRVGGIDGRFTLWENWVLSLQGVTSATRDPEEDDVRLAGPAYNVELSRRGRQFFYQLEYEDVSPGFRTESGFVRRVDIRGIEQRVSYRFRPEGKYLISWGPKFNTEAVFDHIGTRLDLVQDSEISWEFIGGTNLGFFYNWDRERLRPADFDVLPENRDFSRNRKGFFFSTSYIPQVTGSLKFSWGTRINFVPPEGQKPVLADLTSGEVELTLRPVTPLRVDNTYILSRLRDRGSSASIFNNHILRSKWNYQFNRELSLRVILQYNSVLANPEFSGFQTTKNLNADFLITYLLNPGTALYIGYNGNAQNLDPGLALIDPPDDLRFVRPRNRYINDAKQFFVKFSYVFRF